MKIQEGKEYQVESVRDVVTFDVAKLARKGRLFEGLPVYRVGGGLFAEDGRRVWTIRPSPEWVPAPDGLLDLRIGEVDEDRKRRAGAKKLVGQIWGENARIFTGRNNDPYDCGRASDEIIAQTEKALKEMIKLRELLEATWQPPPAPYGDEEGEEEEEEETC